MNTLRSGDTSFLAEICQLTASESHCWGGGDDLRDAEAFPGEAIVHTPRAQSR